MTEVTRMRRIFLQSFDIFYDKRIVYKDYAQQKFLKRREPAPPWQQAKYQMRHSIDQLHLSKQKQAQFESKGLTSVEDIAYFFPRRYIDFRKVSRVNDIQVGEFCALEGVVKEKWEGGGSSYTAKIEELKETRPGYKATFYVSWFGTSYYIDKLVTGNSYIFCGKTSVFRGNLYISTPLAFGQDKDKVCSIMPIYSKIQGMSADYMTRQINASIDFLRLNDKGGPKDLFASSLGLMPKYAAIREMHQPSDPQRYKHAAQRMDFEEIYDFYEDLSRKNMYLVGTQVERATSEETTRKAIAALPFPLTDDQTVVIDTIIREAKSGRRIHSIISGDVGCGKTMVAILSCVFMAENGCQSIVMAPTLVLARQHYQSFTAICDKLKITVGLLTTETKKKERKSLLKAFEAGDLDILIGTHSVLSDDVAPCSLGLTIIDEEHKFGVAQKAKLEEFDKAGVHHISMTATPIPRSIANSVYGTDLDVLAIRSMPAGRKPVVTKQYFNMDGAFEKMYEEIQKGHQCYVVCPFIDDSESTKFQDVVSVTAASAAMTKYFAQKPNAVKTGIISGNMKQQSILETVSQFERGELDVLLSTTIVEVGVNVPNATAITIMSAERFGLAGLHQLRGRVGRGDAQSYCLLCSAARTERLDILCSTTDGFAIAEEDFRMRGPGDITGVAQSGDSAIINKIIRRPKLAQLIRQRFFPPAA